MGGQWRQGIETAETETQPQRHPVSDTDFWEVVGSLEPPTADESVLVFDGTLDVARWVECCTRD